MFGQIKINRITFDSYTEAIEAISVDKVRSVFQEWFDLWSVDFGRMDITCDVYYGLSGDLDLLYVRDRTDVPVEVWLEEGLRWDVTVERVGSSFILVYGLWSIRVDIV